MKPTVGRIVHFYIRGHALKTEIYGPYAAVVTGLSESSDSVNLEVFGAESSLDGFRYRKDVSEADPSTTALDECWCWPPREKSFSVTVPDVPAPASSTDEQKPVLALDEKPSAQAENATSPKPDENVTSSLAPQPQKT